jgi:hypothetical protein
LGARSRRPDNEDRLPYGGCGNRRRVAPHPLKLQPGSQYPQHLTAREHPSEEVKVRLGVDRRQLSFERFGPAGPLAFAQVGQTGGGSGYIEQFCAVEADDPSRVPDHLPEVVEPSNPVRVFQGAHDGTITS